jgi:hypothetical protein
LQQSFIKIFSYYSANGNFAKMKLFTFIYALYILVLPLLPCGDREECNDEKVKTSIVKNVDTDHQNHDVEDENCSPFCTCMCCGQIITNLFYPIKEEKSNHSFQSKNIASYKSNFHLSSYLDRIWQPPKFS